MSSALMHQFCCSLFPSTAYCPHTKRIVGFAQDAFDKDVIIEEFKRMGEQVEEEEDDCAEEEEEEGEDDNDAAENKKKKKKLAEGKHYYVFVVQSLTSKGQIGRASCRERV